jgi:hypothetical protein
VKGIPDVLGRFRVHDESKSIQSGFDDLDNPFRRDYLRMAKKLQKEKAYASLHPLCKQREEWLEWLLYIGRLRQEDDRPAFGRVADLLIRSLRRPQTRLNRFTLGAARRILTGG